MREIAWQRFNGARCRQAREARGWNMADLAKASGVAKARISSLEGTAEPTTEEISRLADALEVPRKFFERAPIVLPEGSLGVFRAIERAERALPQEGKEAERQ